MKIGIFGGSFNPPHKRHIEIALELIEKKYIDKVIYVPTGKNYEYKNNLIPDKNRYEMLQLICNKYPKLEVSNYELKEKVVYTYQTLAHFKELYPKDEIYFICGTDNLSYIEKWKQAEEILNNYKILVIKRKGDNIDDIMKKLVVWKKNIIMTDIKMKELSSTYIREQLVNRKSIAHLLDPDILSYIEKNHLYQNEI